MGEPLVEPREHRAWVRALVALGALTALAVVGWLLVGRGGRTDEERGAVDLVGRRGASTDAAVRDTVVGAPAAVNGFLRFAADPRASARAGVSHDYTADGLRQLADALTAMAGDRLGDDASLRERIETVRHRADAMQRGRRWSAHARDAREAFLSAADVLASLERDAAAGAARDVTAARDAAMSVDVDLDPIVQIDRIERSFTATAVVVRRLASAAPPAISP